MNIKIEQSLETVERALLLGNGYRLNRSEYAYLFRNFKNDLRRKVTNKAMKIALFVMQKRCENRILCK